MAISLIQLRAQTDFAKRYAEANPGIDCLQAELGYERKKHALVGIRRRDYRPIALSQGAIYHTSCQGQFPTQEDNAGGGSLGVQTGMPIDHANALSNAVEQMATELADYTAGTTLVAAISHRGKIVTANVGDSRAYVVIEQSPGQYSVERLNRDHKPGDEDETRRIHAEGGRVEGRNIPRLNGLLAASRALGDSLVGPGLSSQADLTLSEAPKGKRSWVITCCDGFTDVGNEDTIKKIVTQFPQKKWAHKLSQVAYQYHSNDNITVNVAPVSMTNEAFISFVADGHAGTSAARYLADPEAPEGQQTRFVDAVAHFMEKNAKLEDATIAAFPDMYPNLKRFAPAAAEQLNELVSLRIHIEAHASDQYKQAFLATLNAHIKRLQAQRYPEKFKKDLSNVLQFATQAQSFFEKMSLHVSKDVSITRNPFMQSLCNSQSKDSLKKNQSLWALNMQTYLQHFLFDNPHISTLSGNAFQEMSAKLIPICKKMLEFDVAIDALPPGDFKIEMQEMKSALSKRIADEVMDVNRGLDFRGDFIKPVIDQQINLVTAMVRREYTPEKRLEAVDMYLKRCNKMLAASHQELRQQVKKVATTAATTIVGSALGALIGFAVGGPIGAGLGLIIGASLSLGSSAPASHYAFDQPNTLKRRLADIAAVSSRPQLA